MNNMEERPWK